MQPVLTDGAAVRYLRSRFPGYRLQRMAGQAPFVSHPVFSRTDMRAGVRPDADVPIQQHNIELAWLDDGDGHVIWAGVCDVCRVVHYWTER